MSRTNPKDAVALLKDDHVRMRTLLSELASPETKSTDRRRQLLDRAERESKVHTKIEEELFYPAFARAAQKSEDAQIADEAIEEHHTFDVTLAELKMLSLDSPEFQPKAKVLSELAEHHMKEEEGEMFPRARVTMGATALEQLVRPMQERRKALEAEWDSLLMKPIKKAQSIVEGMMPSFMKRQKVQLASAAAEPYSPVGRRADLPARRPKSMASTVTSAVDNAQKMGRKAVRRASSMMDDMSTSASRTSRSATRSAARTAASATRSASRTGAQAARAVSSAARATSRTAARTASKVEKSGQRTSRKMTRKAAPTVRGKKTAASRSRSTAARGRKRSAAKSRTGSTSRSRKAAVSSRSRKSAASSRSRTKGSARRTSAPARRTRSRR